MSATRSLSEPENPIPWPDPTPEMLNTPEFEAVWQCIKRWDINVPDAYGGYCGATGNHVRAILHALARLKPAPPTAEKIAALVMAGWPEWKIREYGLIVRSTIRITIEQLK